MSAEVDAEASTSAADDGEAATDTTPQVDAFAPVETQLVAGAHASTETSLDGDVKDEPSTADHEARDQAKDHQSATDNADQASPSARSFPQAVAHVKCEDATDVDMTEGVKDEEEEEDVTDAESESSTRTSKVITTLDVELLHKEPAFAEICSFFNTFGATIGLKHSIVQLEKLFCTLENNQVDHALVALHLTLMRKVMLKWARADKFDLCIQKYCGICPAFESAALVRDIERFGYVDLPMSAKLLIFKALCESQFDYNYKFKEAIFHTFHTYELRLAPIGFDNNGCSFYYQQDFDLNVRVYSVEPGDEAGASWTLRARSIRELYCLIAALKKPEYGVAKNEDDIEIDEEKLVQQKAAAESETGANGAIGDLKTGDLKLELTEEEKAKIVMTNKKNTFWDLYQSEHNINKKQKLREERRQMRLNVKSAVSPPNHSKSPELQDESAEDALPSKKALEKSNNDEDATADVKLADAEEEELNLSAFADDRRILPRRSARNAALTSIRSFTTPRKRVPAKKEAEPEVKKIDESEVSSSAAEEGSSVDDDDEDDEIASSDDEFSAPRGRERKKGKKSVKAKARKARSSSGVERKRAPKPVAFDEESSDEDVQVLEEKKERRKATEKTLCMNCRLSKRPDVLLLCDECDDAWHVWCLHSPLHFVPDGDWFCPKCQHKALVRNLVFAYIQLCDATAVKDEEQRQRVAAEVEATRRALGKERRAVNGLDLRNIIAQEVSAASIS